MSRLLLCNYGTLIVLPNKLLIVFKNVPPSFAQVSFETPKGGSVKLNHAYAWLLFMSNYAEAALKLDIEQ